jgi:hypothetical protein
MLWSCLHSESSWRLVPGASNEKDHHAGAGTLERRAHFIFCLSHNGSRGAPRLRRRLLSEQSRPLCSTACSRQQAAGGMDCALSRRDLQLQSEPPRHLQLARRRRDLAISRTSGKIVTATLFARSPGRTPQNSGCHYFFTVRPGTRTAGFALSVSNLGATGSARAALPLAMD